MNRDHIASMLQQTRDTHCWMALNDDFSASDMLEAIEHVRQARGTRLIYRNVLFDVDALSALRHEIARLTYAVRAGAGDELTLHFAHAIGYALGCLQSRMWFTGEPEQLWSCLDLSPVLTWPEGICHVVAGFRISLYTRGTPHDLAERQSERAAMVTRFVGYMRLLRAVRRLDLTQHRLGDAVAITARKVWDAMRAELVANAGTVDAEIFEAAEDACTLAHHVATIPAKGCAIPHALDGVPMLMQAWSDGSAGLPVTQIDAETMNREFEMIRAHWTQQGF